MRLHGFEFCCGVNEIGVFDGTARNIRDMSSGTGFVVGTFTDRPRQRRDYEALCARYRLVCQTEPRSNRGGNHVFVAIWNTKDSPRQAERPVPSTVPAAGLFTPTPPRRAVQRRGEKLPRF